MKVLILGGTGAIGSYLVNILSLIPQQFYFLKV